MRNLGSRLLASAVAIVAYNYLNTVHEIVSPLISGPVAAGQLTDSNGAYVATQTVSRVFNGSGISLAVLFLVMAAIWYHPIKNIFRTHEKI